MSSRKGRPRYRACARCPLGGRSAPASSPLTLVDVVWVGLSAKKGATEPLHAATMSGEVLVRVEARTPYLRFYRTNLVKCAPVDDLGRLREPTKVEVRACRPILEEELVATSPRLVVALGGHVGRALGGAALPPVERGAWPVYLARPVDGVLLAVVHHPAYVRRRWYRLLTHYEEALSALAMTKAGEW